MRTRSLLLLALVALTLAPAVAAPPPLLDRQLFFGDPEISGAQLSPDGQFLAFIKPLDGTRNIWVKRTDKPFDTARPLTAETKRPIPGYFWSRDGKFILFVQDQGGDENFNIYAVNPAAEPAGGKLVPDARNLTDLKKVRAMIYAVPKNDPDVVYVGLNDRDAAWHDLYRLKISTGEKTLVRKNEERISAWVFDNRGQLRMATRAPENGDTEVLRIDAGGAFTKVYSCTVFESCGPVRFHKDNQRVYMETNKGEPDLVQLVLFDPATGKQDLVESDPDKRVDLGTPIFSELTEELVGTMYNDERMRIYWRDKTWESDFKFLRSKFKGKDVLPASSTKDEKLWLIAATSDSEPGERYLFDRTSRKLTLQYRAFEKLPREALAPMTAIRYKSSDGLAIPAFLTLPAGVPAKGLPLLVFPHGGPWARDSWGYNALAQFFANRGYAVLSPNFRGSTGYGKKFLNAGNLEWGQKMQDDLTWGVKYLVDGGIVDAKRVGIIGGSYGGYATLAGVTFTPDLYAAAVSIVGPSNLITLLESIPPYWEQIRKVFYVRMGDPNTPEGKAQLERQSPLNSAQKIKTPLMVVQGANDPRVNKAESDQIVIALRDRGFPVEYIVAPDEGHGFARPVNNMAMFAAAEKFLSKHLGGRFQESMPPEIATRLAEITVDPKTVVLKPKVAAAALAAPKPQADLAPGTRKYEAKIAMGGNTTVLNITREIKDDGANWSITDNVQTQMGNATDHTVVAKGTLAPVSRSLKQGAVTIELAFKDGKATGTVSMGANPQPIDAELGGALFADGAGSSDILAHLPLAPGYEAAYRNFDVQRMKPVTKQLKYAGTESVTTPAGTFETHKLEVAGEDGSDKTTIWVDRATRAVVKTTATLSQLGGAQVTTEMVP